MKKMTTSTYYCPYLYLLGLRFLILFWLLASITQIQWTHAVKNKPLFKVFIVSRPGKIEVFKIIKVKTMIKKEGSRICFLI
jgi:hypothetical protein